MSFTITHCTGSMESDVPLERLNDLLDELSLTDKEHPDVCVSHESGWALILFKSGIAVLEDVEEGEPMHLGPLDRPSTLSAMTEIAAGKIEALRARPWRPGYGAGASAGDE